MTIEPGLYHIKCSASWTVLDESTDGDRKVHGWEQANVANQRWKVYHAEGGAYHIQNEHSGSFLHAPGSSDGTPLVGSDDASPWYLEQHDEGWVHIVYPGSVHVVDLDNGNAENGTGINLWGRNDESPQQRWFFEKLD